MQWSLTIGRIAGTAIRIHVTFLLFLLWIAVADYRSGGFEAAKSSIIFVLLVFACVVAHEFGHILTARNFGVKTPEVTLLPIGGVANMERIPEDPWQELLVAIAGPMVNVVIAALLIVMGGFTVAELQSIDLEKATLLQRLALINISLVVFNLIPAFPMDGGRVLRALLAMRLGPQRATEIAAKLGQFFAFLVRCHWIVPESDARFCGPVHIHCRGLGTSSQCVAPIRTKSHRCGCHGENCAQFFRTNRVIGGR